MSQENLDIIAEYEDPGQLRARSTSMLSVNTFSSTRKTECGYTGKDKDVDKMIDEERSETGRVSNWLSALVFLSFFHFLAFGLGFTRGSRKFYIMILYNFFINFRSDLAILYKLRSHLTHPNSLPYTETTAGAYLLNKY